MTNIICRSTTRRIGTHIQGVLTVVKEEQASQKLVEQLLFLFRALHRGAESQAVRSGLTLPQSIVMRQLARSGDLSVKELSQKMGLSHSTISGIVDRLERKGLVARFQDPQDRRITKVTMTGKAKNHYAHVLPHRMFSGVVEAFNRATAGEQMKIIEGLAILGRLLGKME